MLNLIGFAVALVEHSAEFLVACPVRSFSLVLSGVLRSHLPSCSTDMDGGVINFWGLKLFTFVPANNLTNSQFTASCFDWFNRMRVLWACGPNVIQKPSGVLKAQVLFSAMFFCRWKGANFFISCLLLNWASLKAL
ncbi:hypothetical protein HanXRQr2_Chr16g0762511 [Helianthus annuus]|uniref:Secreted protein n=1 Tax=Helianthus annuus TaxID=4232 RepID=A0A9K3GZ18_HELAN|nr:hypothetical protein HanXRQr2_Chr16g0762511 [Helianthus annuus]